MKKLDQSKVLSKVTESAQNWLRKLASNSREVASPVPPNGLWFIAVMRPHNAANSWRKYWYATLRDRKTGKAPDLRCGTKRTTSNAVEPADQPSKRSAKVVAAATYDSNVPLAKSSSEDGFEEKSESQHQEILSLQREAISVQKDVAQGLSDLGRGILALATQLQAQNSTQYQFSGMTPTSSTQIHCSPSPFLATLIEYNCNPAIQRQLIIVYFIIN
jgi:hypothetical protein